MAQQTYETVKRSDGRYIIKDPITGNTLDDAQGYGYRDRQKAEKAAWYKFKGGKTKKDGERKAATAFWRAHKEFAKEVSNLLEWNLKEIARGEMDVDRELAELAQQKSIAGFDAKFLKYLP